MAGFNRPMPAQPVVPTVLLVFRNERGETFTPADVEFNAREPGETPIARAVSTYLELPGTAVSDWAFVSAICLDPTTAKASDVTPAFLAALHEHMRGEIQTVDDCYGWRADVDDMLQERGFPPLAPRDPDGARRAHYEAKWHEAAP